MITQFEQWLCQHASGKYLWEQEQDFYRSSAQEVFGQVAVQLGLCHTDLLQSISVLHKIHVQNYLPIENTDVNVVSQFMHLPFPSASVDTIYLPHGLEFSDSPQQLLSEVACVLKAEGKLVITGFNPYNTWYFSRQWNGYVLPKKQNCISANRLKDWLSLLGFDIVQGRFMVYTPFLKNEKSIKKMKILEYAGNRWFPHHAVSYGFIAIKRVFSMHLREQWAKQKIESSQIIFTPARITKSVVSNIELNEHSV